MSRREIHEKRGNIVREHAIYMETCWQRLALANSTADHNEQQAKVREDLTLGPTKYCDRFDWEFVSRRCRQLVSSHSERVLATALMSRLLNHSPINYYSSSSLPYPQVKDQICLGPR